MSCPFWELFVEQVKSAVGAIEGVAEVECTSTAPTVVAGAHVRFRTASTRGGWADAAPVRQRGCVQPQKEELLQIAVGVLGSPLRPLGTRAA